MTVGYRFHPTDAEIIGHYLRLKMNGCDSLDDGMAEIDLCRFDPSELPDLSRIPDDQVWYFFYRLDYKYGNKRVNRTTRTGFWKVTGKVRDVRARGSQEKIGTKKTLVFYRKGRDSKPIKTNWVIHEYQSKEQSPYVVLKLKNKEDETIDNSTHDEGEPSHVMSFDAGNHVTHATIPEAAEREGLQSLLANFVVDFDHPPMMQPPIRIEPGLSNEVFVPRDNHNILGYQLDTDEETEFVNSVLVDPGDDYYREETARTHLNDYVPPKSLSKVYIVARGHTDSFVHEESGQSSSSNSTEQRKMIPRTFELQGRAVPPEKRKEPEKPLPPRVLPLKGSFAMVSEKDKKMVQVVSRRSDLKLWSNESGDNDRKGRFILQETLPSSHRASPPAEYLVNVVVGLLLFIIIIRELLILH